MSALEPYRDGIEPTGDRQLLEASLGGDLLDLDPGPPPTSPPYLDARPVVVEYVERPARPPVNVTVHGPGSGGVIGVALIRALAAIPVAVAAGVAWLVEAILAWARRAIPGDGDRVAVLGGLGLLVLGWLAVVLAFAPFRVNLLTFGALALIFAGAGAYRRAVVR